jgi:hypothetical protein
MFVPPALLYYVLYCPVLTCAVLHCPVLCCAVLCCGAGDVIAALMQQQEPPQHAMQLLGQQQQQQDPNQQQPGEQQQQQQALQDLADGLSGLQLQQQQELAGIAEWEAAMQARRVVSIYRGQGRLAGHGFSDPHWVEGRLWVYEDGSCGFVFMAEPMRCYLVDLQRLDGDL